METRNFGSNLGGSGNKKDINLYISGLPPEITPTKLGNLFSKCGNVTRVKLLPMNENEFHTKAGFVCYATSNEASRAVSEFNNWKLGPFNLRVTFSHSSKKQKENSSNSYLELLEKLEQGPLSDQDADQFFNKTQDKFSNKSYQKKSFHSSQVSINSVFSSDSRDAPHEKRQYNDMHLQSSNVSCRSNSRKPRDINPHNNHEYNQKAFRNCGDSFSDAEVFTKTYKPRTLPDRNSTSKKISVKLSEAPCKVCDKMTEQVCSLCSLVHYCSQSCQYLDWEEHSKLYHKLDIQKKNGSNNSTSTFSSPKFKSSVKEPKSSESLKSFKQLSPRKSFAIPHFPSNVSVGATFDITVTDVDSDNALILCQMADEQTANLLNKLQKQLNVAYAKKSNSLISPRLGDICAAIFLDDGEWYRAVIENLPDNNKALVRFVDYGNKQLTDRSKLMKLEEESLCKPPAICMLCKLHTFKYKSFTEKHVQVLINLLQQNQMVLQAKCIKITNNILHVSLFAGDTSVSEAMSSVNSLDISQQQDPKPILSGFSPVKAKSSIDLPVVLPLQDPNPINSRSSPVETKSSIDLPVVLPLQDPNPISSGSSPTETKSFIDLPVVLPLQDPNPIPSVSSPVETKSSIDLPVVLPLQGPNPVSSGSSPTETKSFIDLPVVLPLQDPNPISSGSSPTETKSSIDLPVVLPLQDPNPIPSGSSPTETKSSIDLPVALPLQDPNPIHSGSSPTETKSSIDLPVMLPLQDPNPIPSGSSPTETKSSIDLPVMLPLQDPNPILSGSSPTETKSSIDLPVVLPLQDPNPIPSGSSPTETKSSINLPVVLPLQDPNPISSGSSPTETKSSIDLPVVLPLQDPNPIPSVSSPVETKSSIDLPVVLPLQDSNPIPSGSSPTETKSSIDLPVVLPLQDPNPISSGSSPTEAKSFIDLPVVLPLQDPKLILSSSPIKSKYESDERSAKEETTAIAEESVKFVKISEMPSIEIPNKQTQLFISHVDNPNSFYCQLIGDDLLKLNDFLQLITKNIQSNSKEVDYRPIVGEVCAAVFCDDELWYRAEVLEVLSNDMFLVQYFDFGNTGNVNVDQVQPLAKEFLSLPIQAFEASLKDCVSTKNDGIWCNESIDYMKSFLMKPLRAIVETTTNYNETKQLNIYVNDNDTLASHLISQGLAKEAKSMKKTPSPSSKFSSNLHSRSASKQSAFIEKFSPVFNEKLQISITCCQKSGLFHCHVVNSHLESLCDSISELTLYGIRSPQILTGNIATGMYCAALSEDEQTWNRAVVIKNHKKFVTVKFIDYGNIEDLSMKEVISLPEEFKKLPILALACTHANLKPVSEDWDDKYFQVLNDCVGQELDAMFVSKDKSNKYSVQIPFLVNKLIKEGVAEFSL